MREQYDDDINARNYWPRTELPPRELVARTLRLLARGDSKESIVRRTGLSTNRVLAISRLPERYDPIDDQVAIDRALAGDRTVMPGLSFYERQTIMQSIEDRFVAEPFDRALNNWRSEKGEPHWLTALMNDWGLVKQAQFRNRLVHRTSRAA